MELHYHSEAIRLLGIHAEVDPKNLDRIQRAEARLGVHLPESVREWYSLMDSVGTLEQWSGPGMAILLGRFSERPESEVVRPKAITHPLLPILLENQGVCRWAVALDGSTDPPVYVQVEDRNDPDWALHAEDFSSFLLALFWDFREGKYHYSAQETSLSGEDLRSLEKSLEPGPPTYRWPARQNWRFRHADAYLSLWHSEGEQTDWMIHGTSEPPLLELLRMVIDMGELRRTLYACNAVDERLLALIE